MTTVLDCPPLEAYVTNPELTALKVRQQATWASGDFAVIGTTLQIVGESLCEAADLRAGQTVLDVACGNGNAALAAARRFCNVTGIDYVPALLARAAERARAERLAPSFMEADAEQLPFPDASFDAVLSTFGVMFTADHERAAAELARVCKPLGKIALASWTPEGFLGDLLRLVGRYVPPPQVARSPLRWGTSLGISELFGDTMNVVDARRTYFAFRYQSAAHFIEVFRRFYGPTHKALEALDEAGRGALTADMMQLLNGHDRGRGNGLVVPGEYLEIVMQKRVRAAQ